MATTDRPPSVSPPPASRRDHIIDTMHGVAVADPYRWLEESSSAEVRAWTDDQNARTAALLSAIPGRAALHARLTDLFRIGMVAAPERRGHRLLYLRRHGDQAQAVLCWRNGLDGEERVLVDPNRLDERGLTALDWWHPSHDGRRLAFGVSESGDEWSTLRIIEVDTGHVLSDSIDRTRFSSVAWLPGNGAFYYTRYPAPGSVPPGQEHYNRHAFLHHIGDDPATNRKIFGEGRLPQDMVFVSTSPDGRWLVAGVAIGWSHSELYLRDLSTEDAPFQPLVEGVDALFDNLRFSGDRLLLRTNLDASRYRVAAIDLAAPEAAWATIVPEQPKGVIEGFELAGGRIVTSELDSAISRVHVYTLNGRPERELALPGLGSVYDLAGEPDSSDVVVCYTSFTAPASLLSFDLETGERRSLTMGPAPEWPNADDIAIEQVHYPTKDGTLVSMFLCHRRDLRRDGTAPTILTGYGGFNIPRRSEWQASLPAWIERGGLVAIPNLRGGGEYGEEWHRAGMLERKQNVFDDFIAAAEWLIANDYTHPERLAARGGSNGGLLVGAAITQRPDLFRAAVCMVPLLDMIRYHLFSVAKLWIPEYGAADDAEAFQWLHAYSPYHRVRPGVRYPAVLFTAAEQDSRVDPLHARKMTALMQWAASGDEPSDNRPVLLRLESNAGHGAGKPLGKRVEEAADESCFLTWQLGLVELD